MRIVEKQHDEIIRLGNSVKLNHDLCVGTILLRKKDSKGIVLKITEDGYDVQFFYPDELHYVRGIGNHLIKL